ncbi:hypothetical protein KPH14_009504 [Odynerus spinipes]|uniref:Scavenger receptor class B member 1 n=1 Tax=Odynerus spinipes TaxID=1348599 RepID=A0AAD9VRK5_9HYME|nr:hypothetical protein KPH14_009504 [Odynerus spinipes]
MKPKDEKQVIQKDQPKLPRNWYVWATAMAALSSSLFLVIFWCTNIFGDAILSNLIIRNGTTAFEFWQRSPVRLLYKIYIFNYTNVEDFESGKASKLKVQELGPYMYRETMKRVNIQMHDNHTVSYQEEKSFQWEGGSPDDEPVVVPNVPLLGAVSYTRDMNFATHFLLNIFLGTLQPKTFVNVNAGDFLWGYDDKLFKVMRTLISFKKSIPYENFGILASANGVSQDRITMCTGSDDLNNLGLITRINGKNTQNIWGDEKCDRIYGTDGSLFPPNWIHDRNTTLHVYAKELCRPMPFRFDGYNETHGIPTLRYKISTDVFNNSATDSCYCPKMAEDSSIRRCPPVGIYNSSACNFNTPTLVSFPHFYGADESVFESIDGLKSEKNLHGTYLDIHPRLGVPMGGSSKLQLNIEVRKAIRLPYTGRLKDGTILPLIWVDTTLDTLPQNIRSILYDAHFIAAIVELFFQWGSLLVLLSSIIALVFTVRKHRMHCETVDVS